MNNKKWLLGLFSFLFIVVLAACSGNSGVTENDGGNTNENNSSNNSSGSEVQEISFWAPFSGADGPFMKKIVDEYNKSQDKYKVDFQIVPQTDYYKTVDLAFNGGKDMPDVLIMHGDQIFTYSEKGILKPLDGILGGEVTADQYHQRGIEAATVNGEIYGLPLDIHPLMFYWNKDMFEAAGLDPDQPPKNREEFLEYAQKLTNMDENQYGFAVPTLWPQQFIFPTIVAQNGGQLYKDGEVTYTAPEVVEALQFQKDLIEEYKVSPADVQQDGEVTLFLQGRNAMHLNGPWMLQQWVDAGINFGVAPVPQLGTEQQAVFANSHNFVIPDSVDDSKVEGILNFLRYVGDNTLAWAESGQAPAAKATYESDAFQEVNIQSPQVAKQFDDAVFSPDVENWGQAIDPLMEGINKALLGQTDVESALQEAQEKATRALK